MTLVSLGRPPGMVIGVCDRFGKSLPAPREPAFFRAFGQSGGSENEGEERDSENRPRTRTMPVFHFIWY